MRISAPGLETRPVSSSLGTEVAGIDLREEQPPEVVDALRAAFRDTGLLLVREQELTFDEQQRFAGYVGLPTKRLPDGFVPGMTELPSMAQYISNTRPDGVGRERNLLKHSDYCFEEQVLLGVCLYAEVAPRTGGETIFVNARRAAAALGAGLRAKLDGVDVRHVYDMDGVEEGFRKYDIENKPRARKYVRPALLTHPVTGDEVLYVNELMTDRVEGLPPDESSALLDEIYQHLDRPEFRYDHAWSVGDLIVWDNIALQHGRTDMPLGEPRSMRRLMLDVPA